MDDAFVDEYGFPFQQFCKVIYEMIEIGESQSGEVKTSEKNKIIQQIKKQDLSLNDEIINKIISHISLEKREDFLKSPKPYRSEDVYPWRFNRELSVTRCPIIIRDGIVIWGNRCLYHMLKI